MPPTFTPSTPASSLETSFLRFRPPLPASTAFAAFLAARAVDTCDETEAADTGVSAPCEWLVNVGIRLVA
jgi:hypothetical protein